jgi:hypothetical protein
MEDGSRIIKGGYFSDDGREIDPLTVPLPALCTSCSKYNDAKEEAPCLINRMDQMEEMRDGERFLCFAYEPKDPLIDKDKVLREMEEYWDKQNQEYLKKRKNEK